MWLNVDLFDVEYIVWHCVSSGLRCLRRDLYISACRRDNCHLSLILVLYCLEFTLNLIQKTFNESIL